MSTPAQIEANRINSFASTGPRSPEGKAVSSRNALSHGLSSLGDPVLPYEDRAEFTTVTQSYATQFCPLGPHETYLINEMVAARWRIARADRLLNIILSAFAAGQNEPSGDDPEIRIARQFAAKGDPIAKLERHRAMWERAYHRCLREFRAAVRQHAILGPEVEQFPLASAPILNRPPAPTSSTASNPFSTPLRQNEPTGDAKTYMRPQPKIGRNDYCPCGSGLKHKKCCLNRVPPQAHGCLR